MSQRNVKIFLFNGKIVAAYIKDLAFIMGNITWGVVFERFK
jgi:hypothetical protein